MNNSYCFFWGSGYKLARASCTPGNQYALHCPIMALLGFLNGNLGLWQCTHLFPRAGRPDILGLESQQIEKLTIEELNTNFSREKKNKIYISNLSSEKKREPFSLVQWQIPGLHCTQVRCTLIDKRWTAETPCFRRLSAYYAWPHGSRCSQRLVNTQIMETVEKTYTDTCYPC